MPPLRSDLGIGHVHPGSDHRWLRKLDRRRRKPRAGQLTDLRANARREASPGVSTRLTSAYRMATQIGPRPRPAELEVTADSRLSRNGIWLS